MRPVPDVCLDLLHKFEGFKATASNDEGRPSIGYGHDIFAINDPLLARTITPAEADSIALDDLSDTARRLEAVVGDLTVSKLTDGQWAALIDFAFNEGVGRFEGSTMLTKIRGGDFAGASAEFERWIYVRGPDGVERVNDGLVARRGAEQSLWDGHALPAD